MRFHRNRFCFKIPTQWPTPKHSAMHHVQCKYLLKKPNENQFMHFKSHLQKSSCNTTGAIPTNTEMRHCDETWAGTLDTTVFLTSQVLKTLVTDCTAYTDGCTGTRHPDTMLHSLFQKKTRLHLEKLSKKLVTSNSANQGEASRAQT